MTPEGLEMTQTSPFSKAVVVLLRQRATRLSESSHGTEETFTAGRTAAASS